MLENQPPGAGKKQYNDKYKFSRDNRVHAVLNKVFTTTRHICSMSPN